MVYTYKYLIIYKAVLFRFIIICKNRLYYARVSGTGTPSHPHLPLHTQHIHLGWSVFPHAPMVIKLFMHAHEGGGGKIKLLAKSTSPPPQIIINEHSFNIAIEQLNRKFSLLHLLIIYEHWILANYIYVATYMVWHTPSCNSQVYMQPPAWPGKLLPAIVVSKLSFYSQLCVTHRKCTIHHPVCAHAWVSAPDPLPSWHSKHYRVIHYNLTSIIHQPGTNSIIPAKPLHNRDIVSVHFNNFYCMEICDKLTRHLSMLTYIYLNVDEC